jgi:uncharacterized protein
MEFFRELYFNRIESVQLNFKRFLFDEIDWNDRLVGIIGARGSGKTTLVLQYIKERLDLNASIYISLDHIYFHKESLLPVVDYYYKMGIVHFIFDEVHKCENWSIALKNIYDYYPNSKIVFTGSSILEIYKGQADLSRRAIQYELKGLSFREFLNFDLGVKLKAFTIEQLISDHITIARNVKEVVRNPLVSFERYLKLGYYPYYKENETKYLQQLQQTINLILETDVMAVESITYASVRKIKSLLYVISQSVPFKPNISSLSQKVDTKREKLIHFLDILERASVINLLREDVKGISKLNKPDKIYLANTNLIHAYAEGKPDKGNERETFFYSQCKVRYALKSHEKADFSFENGLIFEVGGKQKNQRQIMNEQNAYIAADGIEIGNANKIPLWLFGFLY